MEISRLKHHEASGVGILHRPNMLYRNDGEPLDTFEAHWADWDQQGRLVATAASLKGGL